MTASNLALLCFVVIALIMLLFAALVLGKMWKGTISLDNLLAESDSSTKASLSRFQFLLFTFVVAGLFLLLSIESGQFVEIPTNVLILMGISSGSFVLSKSVSPGGALNKTEPNTPRPRTRTTKIEEKETK